MSTIFRTASVWLKIAIISFAVGLLLFIIGFATASWIAYPRGGETRGLWQFTSRGSTHTYGQVNDFHRAIQAMECIGLIGYGLAILTLFLYMCGDSFRRRDFLQAATVFTFAGILFACIGFALFGSSNENNYGRYGDIGWSMGIAIAGTILYGVGGIMLIIQLIR